MGLGLIPAHSRTRRLRMSEKIRRLVRETTLEERNFILPIFVTDDSPTALRPISSMPGVYQYGIENVLRAAEKSLDLGIGGILLFSVTQTKDDLGSYAHNDEGIVQQTCRAVKERFPELLIATDVCLCEYTSHGHCGIISESSSGYEIVNDDTVEQLALEAVSHARAGSDLICPSDMMDGRIGVIREALDDNGFTSVPIMSYSAKYASAFYGPFRDAAESAPAFGDRRSHQLDPANIREAVRVIERDINEGADIIMVKPALSCLDVIRVARDMTELPIAAYQVSGEFAMIKAAAANAWIDEMQAMMESLLSIKRAGADIIITYFAIEAAHLLRTQ